MNFRYACYDHLQKEEKRTHYALKLRTPRWISVFRLNLFSEVVFLRAGLGKNSGRSPIISSFSIVTSLYPERYNRRFISINSCIKPFFCSGGKRSAFKPCFCKRPPPDRNENEQRDWFWRPLSRCRFIKFGRSGNDYVAITQFHD